MRALVLMVVVAASCKQDDAEKAIKHFDRHATFMASPFVGDAKN